MRRFSSTDLFCLFLTWLATSMVICSDVSTYPSWTLSDVPTTAASLITLTSSTRFRPDAYDLIQGPERVRGGALRITMLRVRLSAVKQLDGGQWVSLRFPRRFQWVDA